MINSASAHKQFKGGLIIGTILFIVIYLIDGIQEMVNPDQALGFSYKAMPFYFLKLFYAIILLLGGILLFNKNQKSWYLLHFTGIGTITSACLFYLNSYIFRSVIIDLFALELLSIVLLILLNIPSFTSWLLIEIPKNRACILLFFIAINIIVNYGLWHISRL